MTRLATHSGEEGHAYLPPRLSAARTRLDWKIGSEKEGGQRVEPRTAGRWQSRLPWQRVTADGGGERRRLPVLTAGARSSWGHPNSEVGQGIPRGQRVAADRRDSSRQQPVPAPGAESRPPQSLISARCCGWLGQRAAAADYGSQRHQVVGLAGAGSQRWQPAAAAYGVRRCGQATTAPAPVEARL